MTQLAKPLVLVVRDAALRSTLAARLGLAGEALLTAGHCAAVDPLLRTGALLIVCHDALAGARTGWPAMLRAQGWDGRIVILVEAGGVAAEADGVVLIGLDDKAALVAIVSRWRGGINPE